MFLSNIHSIFSVGGCTCEFLVPSLVCAELSRVKFSSTSGSPAVDTFAWLRENTSGSALRRPVRPVRTKSLMVTPQSPEGHSAILIQRRNKKSKQIHFNQEDFSYPSLTYYQHGNSATLEYIFYDKFSSIQSLYCVESPFPGSRKDIQCQELYKNGL